MAYPEISFVDGPSEDAAVRLDLNSEGGGATCRVEHDSFSLGAPPLLGDPDVLSAALGLRSASWVLQIKGPKGAAYDVRTAVSRELLRPTNWVRIRLAPTAPVHYMKSYRSDLSPLDLTFVKNDSGSDVWRLPVALAGEPLLYGERITLGPYTVTQDATGTNPMCYELPVIEGDAPTPLRVSIVPSDTGGTTNRVSTGTSKWLVGAMAGTSAMSHYIFDIGGTYDAVTNLNGTSGAISDVSCFGGGCRMVTVAAATPNLLSRFAVLLQGPSAGRFKVYLRCRYTAGAATTLMFRLQQATNGSLDGVSQGQSVPIEVVAADTGRDFWVELGDIAVPFGASPPTDGASGTPPRPSVIVDIGTADGGAASVDVDALLVIPADGPDVYSTSLLGVQAGVAFAGYYAPFGSNVLGTLDGDSETGWGQFDTPAEYVEQNLALRGGFPVVDPAAGKNLLLVMAEDSGPGSGSTNSYITATGATATVTVSYHPRKLHI